MGTRADFYTADYEWLGAIAWDGYPEGIPDTILNANNEGDFKTAVTGLQKRDDWSSPNDGWPWPWDDSQTTDYAYQFHGGSVRASCFGSCWFDPSIDDYEIPEDGERPEFPKMDTDTAAPYGSKRSGGILLTSTHN